MSRIAKCNMRQKQSWKYSKELIDKAIRMRKAGYQVIAIMKELGFESRGAVRYYTTPGSKEKRLKTTLRWVSKNHKRVYRRMRIYSRAYKQRIKKQKHEMSKM